MGSEAAGGGQEVIPVLVELQENHKPVMDSPDL